MKKGMQKLLSVFTAGLFVLQSASLVATGVFAGGTEGQNEVSKYTPALDGKLDDQYKESFKTVLDTSEMRLRTNGKAVSDSLKTKYADLGGNMAVTAYYLWDESYIYVYADVTDATISEQEITNPMRDDNVLFTVWNGVEEDYNTASAEVLINAPHNYAYANTKGDTSVASNFSDAYGTATESSEYVAQIKKDNSGYVIETRIAVEGLDIGTSWKLALGGNDYTTGTFNMFAFGFMYEFDDCSSSDFLSVTLGGTNRVSASAISKATAVVDGEMDEAYLDSFFVKGDHTEVDFLWDDNYYYIYADIKDSTANDGDVLYITLMHPHSQLFWSDSCTLEFRLNKNTAVHTINFSEAYEGCGYNFGLTDDVGTEPSEFKIVRTEGGYIVEARIVNTSLSVAKEMMFGFGVQNDGAWYDGLGDADNKTWQKVYNGGDFASGDGTVITCGAGDRQEVIPTEGNIVKKGTPDLDGRLDGIYKDSYMIDTRDLIKAGSLQLGWCDDATSTLKKYISAGFISSESDKVLKPTGDFEAECLTYAQIYFLWDEDALYIFTKVYDNDIHDLCEETDYTYADLPAQIALDMPWLNESIIHNVYPERNSEIKMEIDAVASGAICDRAGCSNPGVGGWCEACQNFESWSTLHCWSHVDEATKRDDRENLASMFRKDEGYYTIEVRVPVAEREFANTTLKDYFLFSGEKFDYNFSLWDVRSKLLGGVFSNYSANSFISFQNNGNITMVLSGEEAQVPECEHEWNTEYTVERAATCTEDGERSIHCVLCDAVKPGSIEVIPAEGHKYEDGFCTVCGAAEPISAKKYTPELDGVLDDAYLDSGFIKASELAKNGKLGLGWCGSDVGISALVKAGLIADADSKTFLPDGDFTSPAFADAEVYFLWDEDALYIYSKVYDNDIINIADSEFFKREDVTLYSAIGADRPWINDVVTHTINPLENIYATIAAGVDSYANFTWDQANGGWSELCYFEGATAEQREESAKNAKATVNLDEGWYGVELRIPISTKDYAGTPVKEAFLKDGSSYTYNYQLVDSVGKSIGSPFNGYQCSEWIMYTTSSSLTVQLTDEAPHVHTWDEDYTVDTEPTCTEVGQKSIHCSVCDAVKPGSEVSIDALGHDWAEEYTVDKAATCTETGSESIHCTVCGEQDPETVREIPMTEHSFGEDGKCEACGYILGDVNADGELDTKDLVRLMKYLASDGNDESIVATVPDVNRDGSVDTRDLVRLMKMLAEG